MPGIIVAQDTNNVTEVGNVIVISGSGLTADQITKLANTPSDTTSELALKAPLASPAFTGTPTGITKSHVGLGNVDNTSDANKPVSTPQQTALDLKADSIDIDIINTTLSSKADLVGGKVPASQLPEGIDEVQEYANLAAFPATGATNVIYIDLFNNKPYRWGGTQYAPTDSGVALGSTSSTAHRGDHGATAYTHSQVSSGNPHNVTKSDVGLSNADNTSDANKPVSTAQQTALDAKANIASPTFTGTVGGISKSMVGLGNVDNTSDLNKPISTATQAALDLKAEPGDYAAAISITGTHDETTTAIDFSSVQGKATTLTANRTFTVSTGLSASNPIGYHLVTHANFTPTYSDVDVVLDSPINKSGKYYLKFTRQPDGTITQSNQSGGGVSSLSELGVTATTTELNKLTSLLAGKPIAYSVSFSGSEQVGQQLSGAYSYGSGLGNLTEGTSTFKWYRADDSSGTNEAAISGATSVNYTLQSADESKYIRLGVTPVNSAGSGTEVYSDYSGAILASSVDFGATSILANSAQQAAGQKRGVRFTAPISGNLVSISLYHGIPVASGNMYVAVYTEGTNQPTTRLAVSALTAITEALGFQTVDLVSPLAVTADTQYWLVWDTSQAMDFYYENGLGNLRVLATSGTFGEPSDPFGAISSTADTTYNIYGTIEP